MSKMWDDRMKRLIWAAPQDFTTWLLPGAIFIERVTLELKNLTRTINTDTLYKISFRGQTALLHVEFQKRTDPNMRKRVWEYNVLATLAYDCPVYSFVIYLVPDSGIPEAKLTWGLDGLEKVHDFHFTNVKLWELPQEALKEKGLIGLLPLLILTKGGQQHKVAEEVFDDLAEAKKDELLALAMLLASMIFTNEEDQQWLERRQAMLEDILSDTWLYKKLQKEAREEAREEGIQNMRLIVLDIVKLRFPEIASLAEKELQHVQDPAVLRQLSSEMVAASTLEEAVLSLVKVGKNGAKR